MEMLTLGSIVVLKHGSQPVVIISRGPMYNDHGNIGYFEYGACPYPNGYMGGDVLFFNGEDIDKVLFEGYRDALEDEFQKIYGKKVKETTIKKLHLNYLNRGGASEQLY